MVIWFTWHPTNGHLRKSLAYNYWWCFVFRTWKWKFSFSVVACRWVVSGLKWKRVSFMTSKRNWQNFTRTILITDGATLGFQLIGPHAVNPHFSHLNSIFDTHHQNYPQVDQTKPPNRKLSTKQTNSPWNPPKTSQIITTNTQNPHRISSKTDNTKQQIMKIFNGIESQSHMWINLNSDFEMRGFNFNKHEHVFSHDKCLSHVTSLNAWFSWFVTENFRHTVQ